MKDPDIGDTKIDEDDAAGQTGQSTERQSQVPSEQNARAERQGSSDVIPFFIAALLGAITALWGNWFIFGNADEPDKERFPEFVVIESDTLLQAKIQETIMSGAGKSEEIADEFRNTMNEVFAVYTNRGVSVMHKNALMAFPKEYDVTIRVAERLGISEETIDSVKEFQRTGKLPKMIIDQVATTATNNSDQQETQENGEALGGGQDQGDQ